jgi:hypothetical protein
MAHGGLLERHIYECCPGFLETYGHEGSLVFCKGVAPDALVRARKEPTLRVNLDLQRNLPEDIGQSKEKNV